MTPTQLLETEAWQNAFSAEIYNEYANDLERWEVALATLEMPDLPPEWRRYIVMEVTPEGFWAYRFKNEGPLFVYSKKGFRVGNTVEIPA